MAKKTITPITASEIAAADLASDLADEKEEAKQEENPVQPVLKHQSIVFHGAINGIDVYGYTSHEILDVADKVYALFGETPVVTVSGEVLLGDTIIRLRQEQAIFKNVVDDNSWHLPLLGIDVSLIGGTAPKARIGVNRPGSLEKWEQSTEREVYRAKLLDALKQK